MASHFTFVERKFLYRLKKQGLSNAEIGRAMGRHRSTIGRELQRNTGQRGYRPHQAQRLANERRVKCRRPHKMMDSEVHRYVKERLNHYWSPDQIAGRVRRDYPRARRRWLSRQTIYAWIDAQAPEWRTLLRRGGRPPETRGKLRDCVRISGRPDVINRRRRYGDWEGDTIVSGRRHSALLTLVERKSGYARLGRIDEWHLDFDKSFGHIAFEVGAWSCQPAVMVASLLLHARLEAIGAVSHAMCGNRAE